MTGPNKSDGKMKEMGGAVKETLAGAVGAHEAKADGASKRAEGKAEVQAAKTKGHAEGQGKDMKGNLKEMGGKLTGDKEMQAKGKGDQAKGAAQKKANS